MPALSTFLSQALLNWTTGAGAATQPGARWVGLAVGTPTSVSGSEMGTLTGYSRLTALFSSATTAASVYASNSAAMTFGAFSSVGSALGLTLWDGSPVGSSDLLAYGTLQTARTFNPGDLLVFAAGALSLTLS